MAEPREGTFVGIDPVSMKAMNDDLATVQDMIKAELPKLRTAFGQAALETTPIDRLLTVGQWIETELPMLKRRQSLAAQLQKEGLQLGLSPIMVKSDGTGNFPSIGAAVARAKELAGRYIEPGKLPAEVWDEIARNQNDPDFAAAFAKSLGPHAARLLVAGLGRGSKNPDRLPALATLFATASHQQVFDDSWFPKFPAVPGILQLMEFGTWNNDLLVRVGNLALDADLASKDDNHLALVLAAIARSPIAANRLYEENFDQIQAMSRAQAAGWTNGKRDDLGDPLGLFIQAATVDARTAYEGMRPIGNSQWPNPAEDLTRRLLMDLQKNPRRAAFTGVQAAYTAIATEYFDDLNAAIAGPPVPEYYNNADSARPGIEAPDAAWRALVQQAMWDPKNAAILSTFFCAKYDENSAKITLGGSEEAPFANSFSNWQNGQVRGWFLSQLNTVKADATKETADYNAKVKQWVDYVVDPANAAVFATGGVVGARTAAAKTINGFIKTSGTNSVKASIIEWFEHKVPDYPADPAWTSDSSVWQDKAGLILHKNHAIKPVTDSAGTTWRGDPAYYEKLYGAEVHDWQSGKAVRGGLLDVIGGQTSLRRMAAGSGGPAGSLAGGQP